MKVLINFIKGVVIGIATLVPGVSGGTMAIILNIYDDLIHSVSSFFKDIKNNVKFLLQIGIGAVVGLGLFSNLMTYALDKFLFPTVFLFLGIVFGGIPVLYKEANKGKKTKFDFLYFFIGLVIVLLMTFESGTIINLATATGFVRVLFLILAGFIIAIALILPGISTSFMLLTLGLYDITLNAIKGFDIGYIIPIGIGALLGVVLTTRMLENLLKNKPRQTYLLILGFVIGSIYEVFPGIPSGLSIVFSILTFVIGFVVISFISRKS